MSITRAARAGETIILRSRFIDDLSEAEEASSVYVHIYEPDTTDFSFENALVVSGIPTYFGEGIFEYEFPIPNCSVGGEWYDVWYGTLTCQVVSGIFSFNVVASGIAQELHNQLSNNNVVKVTIASGIAATDGSYLEEPYEIEFLTTINPSYTSARKVRLEIGSYLANIPDYTIQSAILEGSIEADLLTFQTSESNTNFYQHARREYVTCYVASILLNNIAANSLKSKTLDNLSVQYDTTGLQRSLDRLANCMDKWLPQLMAAGLAKSATNPSMVVKGELDPDRHFAGRMWETTSSPGESERMPLSNTKVYNTSQRRLKNSYRKRWW